MSLSEMSCLAFRKKLKARPNLSSKYFCARFPEPSARLSSGGGLLYFGAQIGRTCPFFFSFERFFASDRSNFVSALCLDIQIECCADVRMTQ